MANLSKLGHRVVCPQFCFGGMFIRGYLQPKHVNGLGLCSLILRSNEPRWRHHQSQIHSGFSRSRFSVLIITHHVDVVCKWKKKSLQLYYKFMSLQSHHSFYNQNPLLVWQFSNTAAKNVLPHELDRSRKPLFEIGETGQSSFRNQTL
jgi:hypothetical protein